MKRFLFDRKGFTWFIYCNNSSFHKISFGEQNYPFISDTTSIAKKKCMNKSIWHLYTYFDEIVNKNCKIYMIFFTNEYGSKMSQPNFYAT